MFQICTFFFIATVAVLVLATVISCLNYYNCFLTEFPVVLSLLKYIYQLRQLGCFNLEVTEDQQSWHKH